MIIMLPPVFRARKKGCFLDASNKVDFLIMDKMNEYKHLEPFWSGYKQKYHSMAYREFTGIHLSVIMFWKYLLV